LKQWFKYGFAGLLVALSFQLSAQCWVSMLVNGIHTDTVEICPGDSVDLSFIGECVLINNNFNNGQLGGDWHYVTPGFVFQGPCDTASEVVCVWFGEESPVQRSLETEDLDLTSGATLSFSLKYGLQNDPPSCEGPDEMLEGVSLQYSTDQGITWTDIVYFCPDGSFLPTNPMVQSPLTYTPTQFTDWANYSFLLPPPALTPTTRLRWMQGYCSYFNNHFDDNWGIDNVKITREFSQDINWSTGETVVSSVVVNPVQTTTYYVYILGGGNIPDTLAIDSVMILVHDIPQPQLSGNMAFCTGETTTISAGGNFTYLWSTGDTGNTVTFSPETTTNYNLIATDDIGCTGTVPFTLTVYPLPTIDITNDTVCVGETATLSASGGLSYLWSNAQSGPVIQVDPADTTLYTVTVTDLHGCSNTAVASVMIIQPPSTALPADTAVCYGDMIEITAQGGEQYAWNTGAQSDRIVVSPLVQTTYIVTVTDHHGCQNTSAITVFVSPEMTVRIYASLDTICRGSEMVLNADGAALFQWSTGDLTPSINVQPGYTTAYYVTATSPFMDILCSNTQEFTLNVRECSTLFFPNAIVPKGYNNLFKPVGDFSTIYGYSLRIFDRWGKMVFETKQADSGWDGTFDGDFLPAGVYLYQVHYVKSVTHESFDKLGTVTIVE